MKAWGTIASGIGISDDVENELRGRISADRYRKPLAGVMSGKGQKDRVRDELQKEKTINKTVCFAKVAIYKKGRQDQKVFTEVDPYG